MVGMGKKLSAYNLHMKRELKGKMKGKTKAQREKIFKDAARKWKGKSTSRSKPKSRASPSKAKPTGGKRKMTKGSFSMNKIYSLVNKAAFIAPYAGVALDPSLSNEAKVNRGLAYLTGYSMSEGRFDFAWLRKGWEPYFWSKIVTSVVPKALNFVKGVL